MASKTMINLTRMSKVFQPMTTGLPDTGEKTEICQSHKVCLFFSNFNYQLKRERNLVMIYLDTFL